MLTAKFRGRNIPCNRRELVGRWARRAVNLSCREDFSRFHLSAQLRHGRSNQCHQLRPLAELAANVVPRTRPCREDAANRGRAERLPNATTAQSIRRRQEKFPGFWFQALQVWGYVSEALRDFRLWPSGWRLLLQRRSPGRLRGLRQPHRSVCLVFAEMQQAGE